MFRRLVVMALVQTRVCSCTVSQLRVARLSRSLSLSQASQRSFFSMKAMTGGDKTPLDDNKSRFPDKNVKDQSAWEEAADELNLVIIAYPIPSFIT